MAVRGPDKTSPALLHGGGLEQVQSSGDGRQVGLQSGGGAGLSAASKSISIALRDLGLPDTALTRFIYTAMEVLGRPLKADLLSPYPPRNIFSQHIFLKALQDASSRTDLSGQISSLPPSLQALFSLLVQAKGYAPSKVSASSVEIKRNRKKEDKKIFEKEEENKDPSYKEVLDALSRLAESFFLGDRRGKSSTSYSEDQKEQDRDLLMHFNKTPLPDGKLWLMLPIKSADSGTGPSGLFRLLVDGAGTTLLSLSAELAVGDVFWVFRLPKGLSFGAPLLAYCDSKAVLESAQIKEAIKVLGEDLGLTASLRQLDFSDWPEDWPEEQGAYIDVEV